MLSPTGLRSAPVTIDNRAADKDEDDTEHGANGHGQNRVRVLGLVQGGRVQQLVCVYIVLHRLREVVKVWNANARVAHSLNRNVEYVLPSDSGQLRKKSKRKLMSIVNPYRQHAERDQRIELIPSKRTHFLSNSGRLHYHPTSPTRQRNTE